jgi:hypothetical protein
MTREEAISILRNTAWLGSYEMTGKVEEAINIVAEALKAQPNLQPTCNNLATDCVSRQAAIDAILAVTGNSSVRELYEHVQEHELSDMWSGGVNAAIDIIIAVPSVQTESKETSSTHKALDTISRQAAIDQLHQSYNLLDAERRLEDLPSAQPERKTGKWIERNPQNSDKCRLIECDQCGFSHIVGFNVPYEHWIENRNFCERCGADMRGKGGK